MKTPAHVVFIALVLLVLGSLLWPLTMAWRVFYASVNILGMASCIAWIALVAVLGYQIIRSSFAKQ